MLSTWLYQAILSRTNFCVHWLLKQNLSYTRTCSIVVSIDMLCLSMNHTFYNRDAIYHDGMLRVFVSFASLCCYVCHGNSSISLLSVSYIHLNIKVHLFIGMWFVYVFDIYYKAACRPSLNHSRHTLLNSTLAIKPKTK